MNSTPAAQPNDRRTIWHGLALPADAALLDKIVAAARGLREPGAQDFLRQHARILLSGPAATGKPQIARVLAQELGCAFMPTSPSDFKGQYIGQSANMVRQLFDRARAQAPCVLFIDEVDQALPSRFNAQADFNARETVTETLARLDSLRKDDPLLLVLAATDRPEHVDEAVLARFNTRIELPPAKS